MKYKYKNLEMDLLLEHKNTLSFIPLPQQNSFLLFFLFIIQKLEHKEKGPLDQR